METVLNEFDSIKDSLGDLKNRVDNIENCPEEKREATDKETSN